MLSLTKRMLRKFSSPSLKTDKIALFDAIREKYNMQDDSMDRYFEEQVILVDQEDTEVGSMALLESHLNEVIQEHNYIHRAFSLLIFDENHNLLVQRRSHKKMAFPLYWGNSCCSHPLYNLKEERQTDENLGVRLAAERRVDFELNLPIKHQDIVSVGRIYYTEHGEEFFGESEIDHILFARAEGIKPDINFNPREICEVEWVSKDKIQEFADKKREKGEIIAPWFQLMIDTGLPSWWSNLIKHKSSPITELPESNIPHPIIS